MIDRSLADRAQVGHTGGTNRNLPAKWLLPYQWFTGLAGDPGSPTIPPILQGFAAPRLVARRRPDQPDPERHRLASSVKSGRPAARPWGRSVWGYPAQHRPLRADADNGRSGGRRQGVPGGSGDIWALYLGTTDNDGAAPGRTGAASAGRSGPAGPIAPRNRPGRPR